MPPKQPQQRKRPLFYFLAYGVIALAVLLSLLPQFAAQGLRFGLPQMGIGAVEVENIDINLFQGRIAVDELRFYRSAAQVLHLGHGELEFDWGALLDKRLQIRRLELQRLSLTVNQSSREPLRIAGFALPAAGEPAPPSSDSGDEGWGFGIDSLALSDNQLHLIRTGMVLTLGIERFTVSNMKSWEGERAAPIQALLRLDETRLQLDASTKPFASEPSASFKLSLSPLQLATAQPLLPPSAGQLSGQLSAELELELQQTPEQLTLQQRGSLTLAQTQLQQPALTVRGGRLHWQGESELLLTAETTRIKLDGRLDNDELSLTLGDTAIDSRNISWQGKTTLQLAQAATRLLLDGKLSAAALQFSQHGTEAAAGPLSWHGTTHVALTNEQLETALEGTLAGEALQLSLADPGLDATIGQLGWQGKGQLQRRGENSDTSLEGELRAEALNTRLAANNLAAGADLLSWQGTATVNLAESLDLASEAAVTLLQLRVATLDSDTPHTTLERLTLPRLQLAAINDILLGSVRLQGLQSRITLTRQGLLPLQQHMPPASGRGTGAEADSVKESGSPTRLRLAALTLEGNSALRFEDTTVTPRFAETLQIETLSLGALDTARPKRRTPVALKARPGKLSRLGVQGEAAPLASPPELAIQLSLQDYEMPPLSPYLVRLLGYRINSGQLDNKLTLKIENGMLEGETRLKARQLEVEQEDPDRIAEFEQKSTMPVSTALSVLRDKEGDIALTIPFSGSLDDPQFSFQDALNTALAKALRSASISYLKFLLQPYGNLITLVQLAGDVGGGTVQLDPVRFPGGSAELPPDSAEYLERLAGLLTEKENLQLRLCGIATNRDLEVLSKGKEKLIPPGPHEALEQLARERAETLKHVLVEQYALDPGRLFVCNPELERTEGAKPRVRLQL